ncbi:MAG TPA: carboxymuconolactone decarboxylase family protein [Burkholderiales bacterium]|nr:carboxymuconolactone decarboxylase family protein [Burkholderiales bacterium]
MPRISPAPREGYAEVADHVARWQAQKGYAPNSWLTMLRKPKIFRAYRELHTAVMIDDGEVPKGLKFMIAEVVSMATGDAYCAAHNAENAAEAGGVPIAKVEALARFRTSPLFTGAERAALELAEAAGSHPPAVSDSHFETLKKHYSEDAIVEIVAVLALLGWLNRWCMTFAPELEERAAAFAARHVSGFRPSPE